MILTPPHLMSNMSRRRALKLIGGAVSVLAGCGRDRSESIGIVSPATAFAAMTPTCMVRPEQTAGPYFVDEKLNRSDIRIDPSDHSSKPGVPLRLEFRVSRIEGDACAPLDGAIVDVWHCDALGVYSDVRDGGFDTRGKKFLRGYQTTNAQGFVQFTTIYPGWYAGRAVHVHFKIRRAVQLSRAQVFTSQLYFDEAVTDQVLKQAPYDGKNGRRTRNDDDFIFRGGGKQLLVAPMKLALGYTAKFEIGLRLS
jgi:protocatechuate 3,4-dioxygenase beta subunit